MNFFAIWRTFWDDLNTAEDFADQPVKGATNQVGHIAIGCAVTAGICSGWVQLFGDGALTWPRVAAAAIFVVLVYLIAIEFGRQGWAGRDTVEDTAFVALGATLPAVLLDMTPSGRWARIDEASTGFLVWLAITFVALGAYVYPRAKRRWQQAVDRGETARG